MDRVTFDFETGEIIFDCDGHKGVEFDFNLKEKIKLYWLRLDMM